jgi:hypothetical protein
MSPSRQIDPGGVDLVRSALGDGPLCGSGQDQRFDRALGANVR